VCEPTGPRCVVGRSLLRERPLKVPGSCVKPGSLPKWFRFLLRRIRIHIGSALPPPIRRNPVRSLHPSAPPPSRPASIPPPRYPSAFSTRPHPAPRTARRWHPTRPLSISPTPRPTRSTSAPPFAPSTLPHFPPHSPGLTSLCNVLTFSSCMACEFVFACWSSLVAWMI
jgi:hypothetical protein